jgi:hypothetical protein
MVSTKMHFLNLFVPCLIIIFIISCSSDDPQNPIRTEPLYITITEEQHHLGDNQGSEGIEYSANFDVPSSYNIATLSITFLYPNDAGQSGPELDSPPEIQINDMRIGLSTSDFPDSSGCISDFREYECDVIIFKDIADEIKIGNNTVRIISKGAAHDGDDDFVFTDLKIELININI